MNQSNEARAFAVQPGEAESYWQPVPANGFVEVHVSRHEHTTVNPFESGVQEVAPGGHVRKHAHETHEELILVIEGKGTATLGDERHVMQPGTSLYLAPGVSHSFVNETKNPLRFFWVLMPGGLSDFFKAIGRERHNGEQAPAPFARPDNVAQIEADTVFKRLT